MKHIQKDVVIKAVILAGFAIWLIHLLLSGSIELYISPKLTWLSKLSVILLIALTLATLIPSNHGSKHSCCGHGHSHSSEHDHSHTDLSLGKILIFCFPLLLGFTVKPQPLDSMTLANSINTAGSLPFYVTQSSQSNKLSTAPKWPDWQSLASKFTGRVAPSNPKVNNNVTPSTPKSESSKLPNKLGKPISSAVKETDLVQLALNDNPDQIYNQSYRLTGFVYKDPKLAKNQFVITRFAITCCIVDAQPIGIIAESPDAPNLKADTWLEVEGVLKKSNIKDSNKIKPVYNFQAAENTYPYFIVTKLKRISTPQDPYLTVSQ